MHVVGGEDVLEWHGEVDASNQVGLGFEILQRALKWVISSSYTDKS